jgi:short subunit dehydrogenase-like uncharacterized protein
MITLLGATGYTGQLVARALAASGLPLRLAGRSEERLRALAASLPGSPPIRVVDLASPDMLRTLASDTHLLISCAGPFTDLGDPVAALAARHGLRYLDTTNELAYVYHVFTRFAALARSSSATLVPACAFEVALADCAAALLAREVAPRPLDEISVTYWLPGAGSSYGTRSSALRSLATSWLAYRNGAYGAARPCAATRRVPFAGRAYPALAFPSSETMTIPAHLDTRNVTTWMVVSRSGALVAPRLIPLLAPMLQGTVGKVLRALATRAARPPDTTARASMPFRILIEARAGSRTASLMLEGRDPYGLTADIIAHAAALLYHEPVPPGVQPPARVLDPAALLTAFPDRLAPATVSRSK